jgi:hypothetical protein
VRLFRRDRHLDDAQEAKLDLCRKLRLKPGDDSSTSDAVGRSHHPRRGALRRERCRDHTSTRQAEPATAIAEGGSPIAAARHARLSRSGRDARSTRSRASAVEHVGVDHLPNFASAYAALAPGGLFLNHGIVSVRRGGPGAGAIWCYVASGRWMRSSTSTSFGWKLGPSRGDHAAETVGFETRRREPARALRADSGRVAQTTRGESRPRGGDHRRDEFRVWRLA